MIPAQIVLPHGEGLQVGGTLWNGEAVLGRALRVTWRWSPLASLSRLGYAATWRMTGGDTDLTGTVAPGRGTIRLEDVSGQADGTLLSSAVPGLPMSCRFLAQVRFPRMTLGGHDQQVRGDLRTSTLHCLSTAGVGALDLPALRGAIGPASGMTSGALTGPSGQHLVEMRLSRDGALSLWPTAAMTARAPLLAGMRYDTTLGR